MSSSKTKDQKPQLPFLLRALGFIDEDFADPSTAPATSDNQPFSMERAKSPVPITAANFNSLNEKVRPDSESLTEFAEIKSADIPKHYKRIMSSSFPRKKLDEVVKYGYKEKEINDLELEEWKYLYALGGNGGKEFEKNEVAMRQLLNDVMLWGMAVHNVSGEVKDMEKLVEGFGVKTLTLWFEGIEIPFLLKK